MDNARASVKQPRLGVLGWLRFIWTQLTSMSTALFLLLLLAVAAVPGSIFPQRSANPEKVTQYKEEKPDLFPILDKLQFFDAYSSVWFSAIYLLLFISLIGCVIPRAKAHYKHWRSQPPRTPARLERLPQHGSVDVLTQSGPDEVRDQFATLLRKKRYRVSTRDAGEAQGQKLASIGAEKGLIKELGNLVFHISLVGVLIAVAVGSLFGYRGQRILVEGDTFVNTLVAYDNFTPGTNFSTKNLNPYSIRLDKFNVQFDRDTKSATHFGQPLAFRADLTTQEGQQAQRSQKLEVNHPLAFGQDKVYLVGNGYAPIVTVRDGQGKIAFSGPVVSVPQDGKYTSLAVLKVPDAKPSQLAFSGFLLPTTARGADNVSFSVDPDPISPTLTLNAYEGDLGLDNGQPQSIYVLKTDKLKEINSRKLGNGLVLKPNERVELAQGKGSIEFTGLKRYVALDIRHDPGTVLAAVFSALATLGLIVSLLIPRRRLWLTFDPTDNGRVKVSYGLLARGEDPGLKKEAQAIDALLRKHFESYQDENPGNAERSPSSSTDEGSAPVTSKLHHQEPKEPRA